MITLGLIFFQSSWTILDIMFTTGNYTCQSSSNLGEEDKKPLKYILFYSKFYRFVDWFEFGYGQEPFIKNDCCVNNCFVTNNRSLLANISNFDSIIFNTRSIEEFKFPESRSSKQFYVYFSWESPFLDGIDGFESRFNYLFNLTMTYRRDSDIYTPFGKTEKLTEQVKWEPLKNDTRKLAAWIVSHCKTDSGREKYVEEMKKWMPVDQFGDCNEEVCADDEKCYDSMEKKYKFYLSFENSLCQDYITEKFWNFLGQNIVPIVLGTGPYKEIAPPNSYIDVKVK
ncbi:alpha-(1,3)-fucosyltransferase C [Eurytemora carolleeae]|uniref:alpha-(1,3)-fucosyltransferase C n=1 Tax=Eurytemora carolleeae TaxID=1294199 RepID=UPI000C7765B8|nr:alpha-(1,3)-fucosyltransferase C [Eurytemora carolleeae]|eukprot:XP_023349074.1 alpha-(1,3)-fucosyltransferase C-like [Eurytemora affinis]